MPPFTYVPMQILDSVSAALAAAQQAKNQPITYVPKEKSYNINISGDNGFKVSDIKQGNLSDCWLLSSLAGVAHTNPLFLQDHIKPLSNGSGWSVKLYDKEGEEFNVEVLQNDLRMIINPNFSTGDLWVKIYEIAFQTYYTEQHINEFSIPKPFLTNLDWDYAENALPLITGKKSYIVTIVDEYLNVANSGKYIGVTTTSEIFKSSSGIKVIKDHAYSILGFDKNTNTVILNNPWGENKGRSKKENARLAGEFTLTLEEFKKHFSYVTVSDTPALICK